MKNKQLHKIRVLEELKQVGVTRSGLRRFTSRYVPDVVHENEHIHGAVYGRFKEQDVVLEWVEAMLIATDRRIIFLCHRPGYTDMDELTYDMVAGIKHTTAWPFAAITLHSRIGDFTIRFANRRAAQTFVHYLEVRQIERASPPSNQEK